MDEVEITIIGAGVIGLSIAAELSRNGSSVLVVEKNASFGLETSSRNSEVIHAGIYYPKNSLKAKLCLEGNVLLYELCTKKNIPHRKIGKLIVAVENKEVDELERLFENAKDNGVREISMLNSQEIKEIEPEVRAVAAIYSRSTGIIDSHRLMEYFLFSSRQAATIFSFNTKVINIKKDNGKYRIKVIDASGLPFSFLTRVVVNCAGLNSDDIAEMAGIDIQKQQYMLKYSKGQYFRVGNNKSRFIKRLAYPVPGLKASGLGIHATLDMSGGLRLGPDDKYILRENADYNINLEDRSNFFRSAERFLPFLDLNDLSPDTCGIRPKLLGENDGFKDFVIKDESGLGLPGFINLIGIESPGLTASVAIAKMVAGFLNIKG